MRGSIWLSSTARRIHPGLASRSTPPLAEGRRPPLVAIRLLRAPAVWGERRLRRGRRPRAPGEGRRDGRRADRLRPGATPVERILERRGRARVAGGAAWRGEEAMNGVNCGIDTIGFQSSPESLVRRSARVHRGIWLRDYPLHVTLLRVADGRLDRGDATMWRTMRLAGAAGAAVLAIALPAAPAVAAPSPTLVPPPGCTGDWNTAQSAFHNHAPGTSPGCEVAESHARHFPR